MTAFLVYVPVSEPHLSSVWIWLSLLMFPIVMALIRSDHKPKLRRLFGMALVASALAVALNAYQDEVVIPHPCVACRYMEEGSWERWLCEWMNGVC